MVSGSCDSQTLLFLSRGRAAIVASIEVTYGFALRTSVG